MGALSLLGTNIRSVGNTLRVDTPEFQPRAASPTKNLSQAANAAVFIPRSQGSSQGRSKNIDIQGLSSPPLASTNLAAGDTPSTTPSLTPLASSLYCPQYLPASNGSTPMSQPSLSQSSENNPYADMDMYGNNTNYMDQMTNGYNQMSISQNPDYSSYIAGQQGQQYDPLSDMYYQASTNYQPVPSR
jgi:hypothetical protein